MTTLREWSLEQAELWQRTHCRFCREDREEGSLYCAFCGAYQLAGVSCPSCQAAVTSEAAFCPKCGAQQPKPEQKTSARVLARERAEAAQRPNEFRVLRGGDMRIEVGADGVGRFVPVVREPTTTPPPPVEAVPDPPVKKGLFDRFRRQ